MVDQKWRLDADYNRTNFVLAEIGYGFDAFLKVKHGQIVDGIGGTISSSTWKGEDGEILYLKGELTKEELKKRDGGMWAIKEGAVKDISKLLEGEEEILVSGSQSDKLIPFLKSKFKNVRLLKACQSSNAALGAAIIANGLAGGEFQGVVDYFN